MPQDWSYSMWLWNAVWWHKFGSTLVQVMACHLTAPSHYLNQWWLFINEACWHFIESNFTEIVLKITHHKHWQSDWKLVFENAASCPRGKWNLGSGSWFNVNVLSYQYRNLDCADKTILRLCYLHNEISSTIKSGPRSWVMVSQGPSVSTQLALGRFA